MKAPIDGGGTVTQRFGLPASLVTSLEPAMWHKGERAYWLAFPGSVFSTHFHPGIDRAAPYGTPIVAKEDGVVTFAGWRNNIDGFQVEVAINDHAGYSMNHMSIVSVRVGQHVNKGQQVGRVGQTGATTGPHTHEGVYIREALSDGVTRTMLYDPALFEAGGSLENDPRVQPDIRKFHLNGAGINVRFAPPHPFNHNNVFAISKADGIYRRRDGKRLSGLKYGFVFLNWRKVDGITFAVGTGYGGKKLAVAKSLIHF